jgi:hypothetical protein
MALMEDQPERKRREREREICLYVSLNGRKREITVNGEE